MSLSIALNGLRQNRVFRVVQERLMTLDSSSACVADVGFLVFFPLAFNASFGFG